MVEIKITDTAGDILDSRYIYVDSIFMLNERCDSLEDKDSYQRYEGNYIDAPSTLESIVEFGKFLIKEFNLNNIEDLKLHNNLEPYIINWLLLNPYPYFSHTGWDRCFKPVTYKFAEDCVLCATIYDIHKWLVKLYNDKETISFVPSESKELDNLEASLKFINFDRNTKDTYNIDKELDPCELDLYENQKEDIIYKLNLIRDRIFNEETADIYCDFIIRRMISMLPKFIYSLESPDVKEQIRIYDEFTNEYRTIYTMKSILGIACDELENMLISKSVSGRTICCNPDCNNDFDSNNGQKYCKSVKCQKYRNNIKSKASYNRMHEAKKKASQLND